MIKVVGHWELDWNTNPEIESYLWNLPIRDFGIKDWYMWPITETRNREGRINLYERDNLKTILEENKDLTKVFVEPQNPVNKKAFHNGESLESFEHPKDVLYIFGSAHYSSTKHKTDKDLSVVIPTIQNKGVLWPHQCLVTILYDRLVKRGKDEWQ